MIYFENLDLERSVVRSAWRFYRQLEAFCTNTSQRCNVCPSRIMRRPLNFRHVWTRDVQNQNVLRTVLDSQHLQALCVRTSCLSVTRTLTAIDTCPVPSKDFHYTRSCAYRCPRETKTIPNRMGGALHCTMRSYFGEELIPSGASLHGREVRENFKMGAQMEKQMLMHSSTRE